MYGIVFTKIFAAARHKTATSSEFLTKNMISGVCETYGGSKKCISKFNAENLKVRNCVF
jgi:hypothetical protein